MTLDPTAGADRDEETTPAPDDPRKPDKPSKLTARSWRYVIRKTFTEFVEDQCTDLAAGLTYYSVLAIFPAAIALVSLLGVIGQAEQSVSTALEVLRPLVSEQMLGSVEPTLKQIAESQAAGPALLLGLAAALWTASGYVGAFARAMNRIYEIAEGRPLWKLRPLMVLVTAVIVLMLAAILLMLVLSGPVAASVGDVLGLGEQAVLIWSIVKWPILAFLVVLVVALLYYATPNIQQPRFRWLSLGAAVAIGVWVLASIGFGFYVANFASYNKTYGSLAGVVVSLLFLWISNLALLFGAELDAELERGRQLQAGMAAEEELQLPARDTRTIEKARERQAKDLARAQRVKDQADPARSAGSEERKSDA